ncbi:MAG: alpha-glucan family phosphorylase [Burkholderiales bacterium]|nr:alpha-glucan family phosphorylase [Burkholderiales bacterium]
MKEGARFFMEINPQIPQRLARLVEISDNLWYSWDKPTRTLFARMNPKLWDAVGHNPKVFLRRLDESTLIDAADDQVYLSAYHRVLSSFDTYHGDPLNRNGGAGLDKDDLVAYFCAEFGFHESFPIYSGGLGILAGDHCKAASDMRLPFVGVGFLYRRGYFSQEIDAEGNQIVKHNESDAADLPVSPALDEAGREIVVSIDFPGREVFAKIWTARVGTIMLYLLDTDLPGNPDADRRISHELYGGDSTNRIQQEIILGVGGVRALEAVGLKPTVWHINEGHAAFLLLERIRKMVEQGLDFPTALEAVASNTVFTTHTPVPAGHDHFNEEMVAEYFHHCCTLVGMPKEAMLSLGYDPDNPSEFNMTALAVRASRFQNGVSRIHGEVSSRICSKFWPEILPEENPMTYITNGVHVPTFLAEEWVDLFDKFLGGEWRNHISDERFWKNIDDIPDHLYWSVRQSLKAQMLYGLRSVISSRHLRNSGSEAHLDRILKYLDSYDPNVLTIGFARRFATYKRATLLFDNIDWLKEILSDPERPVIFIFAGKAHPADQPGQDLIRQINGLSQMPEFEGKILLVEGYDMGLSRRLVSGVDVWLNTPLYPLEASGTSGMKASINGAINLSVLDGWWGEGYNDTNGWAVKPSPEHLDIFRRNREESRTLYEILQDKVIPVYYNRGKYGYPEEWVKKSKRAMASVLPRFNAGRMVGEYVSKCYLSASSQGKVYSEDNYAAARAVSAWKAKVKKAWPLITIRRVDEARKSLRFGEDLHFEVALYLDGLDEHDVIVELLYNRSYIHDTKKFQKSGKFVFDRMAGREHIFVLGIKPEICGLIDYQIRVHPYHAHLTHPLECGLMTWL